MLQRIQTVFLCLLAVAMFIFLFLPIWCKVDTLTLQNYTLYAWKLEEINPPANILHLFFKPYMLLGIIATTICLMSVYAIIRFDNRILQLKLGTLNSLFLTALIGILIWLLTKAQTSFLPEISGQYKIGFVMPVVGVVCNLLSNYFIKKDEKLIRSINRIR